MLLMSIKQVEKISKEIKNNIFLLFYLFSMFTVMKILSVILTLLSVAPCMITGFENAYLKKKDIVMTVTQSTRSHEHSMGTSKALFFLILGLWIFFQNIKVGGGKKIKIKITKKIVFI